MLRKFDSGVMVIQNKSHSDEEVISLSLSLSLSLILFCLLEGTMTYKGKPYHITRETFLVKVGFDNTERFIS